MSQSDFAEWEKSLVGFLTRAFVVLCCLDRGLPDETGHTREELFRQGLSLLTLPGLYALGEAVERERDRLSRTGTRKAVLRLTRLLGQISTRASILRDRASPLQIGDRYAQVVHALRYLCVPRRLPGPTDAPSARTLPDVPAGEASARPEPGA